MELLDSLMLRALHCHQKYTKIVENLKPNTGLRFATGKDIDRCKSQVHRVINRPKSDMTQHQIQSKH